MIPPMSVSGGSSGGWIAGPFGQTARRWTAPVATGSLRSAASRSTGLTVTASKVAFGSSARPSSQSSSQCGGRQARLNDMGPILPPTALPSDGHHAAITKAARGLLESEHRSPPPHELVLRAATQDG